MKSSRLLRCQRSLMLASALLVLCAPIFAQSAGTGALTGTLTDPSGASVPNAAVTLTNLDTNQTRTTTTSTDGNYKFSLLPPGPYRVRFSAMGFKTAEVSSVTINVTETPVL
ncbi:MAG TPA: carboxypeptidase-like regulatory domain-containing protein, partial [Terracidiphilus sp.]|nr:carboxypeptidase-like regulatory domain-containing protein [Terracidiphilus sp.]